MAVSGEDETARQDRAPYPAAWGLPVPELVFTSEQQQEWDDDMAMVDYLTRACGGLS